MILNGQTRSSALSTTPTLALFVRTAANLPRTHPRTDYVRIVSHTEGAAPVRLRMPAWSANTEVKLNGKVLDGVAAGSYFTIERDWKLGDIVELKFDMPCSSATTPRLARPGRAPTSTTPGSPSNTATTNELVG